MTSEEVFAQIQIDITWMSADEVRGMAYACDVDITTIYYWGRGLTEFPRIQNFLAAAEYMGYDLNWTWQDTPQLRLVR